MIERQREEVVKILQDCETRAEKLTDVEVGFIDSVRLFTETRALLSTKQVERLRVIWKRIA